MADRILVCALTALETLASKAQRERAALPY